MPHLPRRMHVDVASNLWCDAVNATLATQHVRQCRQVPRLARKQPPRPKYPSAPPVQCQKGHACDAECTSMSPSATPSTQSDGRCRQAHACHANSCRDQSTQARRQCQSSAISATPATQSEGRCHQVPRLQRRMHIDVAKCQACHSRCHQVPHLACKQPRRPKYPSAPPLPVQWQKCHACHAECT